MIIKVTLDNDYSNPSLIPSLLGSSVSSINFEDLINMCYHEMVYLLNLPIKDYFNKFLKINVSMGSKNFSRYIIKDHRVLYNITYNNVQTNPWNNLYVILHEIGHIFQFTLVGMVYAKYFKNTDYKFKEPRITYEEEAADIFASYFLLKYCKKLFKKTNPEATSIKEFIANFVYPGKLSNNIDVDLRNFSTDERHYGNLYNKVNFIFKVIKSGKIYEIYKPYLKAIRTKSNWVESIVRVTESAKYKDTLDVINSLPKKEKGYMTPESGRWVDSDMILYRYVKKIDGVPVGFIDLYPYKLDPKATMANISIAVRPEYQHQGISKELLNKAVDWAKKNNYDLWYAVDIDNKKSLGAALKYGFKLVQQTKDSVYLKLKLRNKAKLTENIEIHDKDQEDLNEILSTLSIKEKAPIYIEFKWIAKYGNMLYIYRKKDNPIGAILLSKMNNDMITACIVVKKEFWGKGISQKLIKKAVTWSKKNGYKKFIWLCASNNLGSLNAAKKYGFKLVKDLLNVSVLSLDLDNTNLKESYLREDLGNTPKGYKDINHIIDNCNEWFENNGNKSDSKIWKQHVQIRNWAKELKKYRSKFGPITFERKISELKLKKKSTDKDGYITLDTAILSMYRNWKNNKYDMEDRNRELMYVLIELRAYRKKFKKQEFSCKI